VRFNYYIKKGLEYEAVSGILVGGGEGGRGREGEGRGRGA